MNSTEKVLTDALDAAAETIRGGTLRPLPQVESTRFRAKAWHTWMAPAAAAAAVVLAVGVAVAIPGLIRTAHPAHAGGAPRASSGSAGLTKPLPRYYAEVEGEANTRPAGYVVVRATGTGAVVARVANPVDAARKQLFAVDVTTQDDHTFYVLYSENKPTGNYDLTVYSFTLSPAGAVTGLAAVNGGVISKQRYLFLDGGFAVSPDGTELAIATADPAAKGIPQALAEQIILINTRTGARVTWQGGLDRAGSLMNIEDLSWTADSDSLVYLAQWCPQGGSDQGQEAVGCIPGFSSEQVRELSVASGGGSLSSGTVLLRSSAAIPYIADAQISPGGTKLTALLGQKHPGPQVVTIDVATGQIERVLYQLPAEELSLIQIAEFHLDLDSTGQHVLLAGDLVHGWISDGNLESLKPAHWAGKPVRW